MAFKNTIIAMFKSLFDLTTKAPSSSSPPLSTTRAIKSSASNIEESRLCVVCLSSLKRNSNRRVLPCSHEFHEACVDKWLSVPNTVKRCPICRYCIEEDRVRDDHSHKASTRQEWFTDEMVIWFSSFHVAGF